jgi:hypothetical protein
VDVVKEGKKRRDEDVISIQVSPRDAAIEAVRKIAEKQEHAALEAVEARQHDESSRLHAELQRLF